MSLFVKPIKPIPKAHELERRPSDHESKHEYIMQLFELFSECKYGTHAKKYARLIADIDFGDVEIDEEDVLIQDSIELLIETAGSDEYHSLKREYIEDE